MKRLYNAHRELVLEFLRYALVGGTSFIVDTGVLFVCREFLFGGLGANGVLLAGAIGFIAGFIFNYFVSLLFVFKGNAGVGGAKSLVVFLSIALIGLLLTELGMHVGMMMFGAESSATIFAIKVVVAGIVMVWNYGARKLFLVKFT